MSATRGTSYLQAMAAWQRLSVQRDLCADQRKLPTSCEAPLPSPPSPHCRCRCHRHHPRSPASLVLEQAVADFAARLRLLLALHRDTHNVGARVGALLDLRATEPRGGGGAGETGGNSSGRRASWLPQGAAGSQLAVALRCPLPTAFGCSAAPTCSTVASTSRVSVVVMVCSAMRCSLPTLTGPICRTAAAEDGERGTTEAGKRSAAGPGQAGLGGCDATAGRDAGLRHKRAAKLQLQYPAAPPAAGCEHWQLSAAAAAATAPHTSSTHVDGAGGAAPRLLGALAVLGRQQAQLLLLGHNDGAIARDRRLHADEQRRSFEGAAAAAAARRAAAHSS